MPQVRTEAREPRTARVRAAGRGRVHDSKSRERGTERRDDGARAGSFEGDCDLSIALSTLTSHNNNVCDLSTKLKVLTTDGVDIDRCVGVRASYVTWSVTCSVVCASISGCRTASVWRRVHQRSLGDCRRTNSSSKTSSAHCTGSSLNSTTSTACSVG